MANLTQTTLSAAITAQATTITVASATGIVGPTGGFMQKLFIVDPYTYKGELVTVTAAPTGTRVPIARLDEYRANHISGAIVLIAPVDATQGGFQSRNPNGNESPTATSPWVNVVTGEQWIYSSVIGAWVPGWGNTAPKCPTTTIASGDSAAPTPSGPLFHMSGTGTITSWTIPVGFAGGSFQVINDAAWQATAGNNVGSTIVAVANEVLTWTYDANTAKFYCSHLAA